MSAFKYTEFGGLYPRMPESMLPPTAATLAQNCEFAYRELRNIKGDYLVQALNNAAASIYTDDGLQFYSWTEDVNAVRSPLANDTFDRLYYTTATDFRVTTRSGMAIGGGEPGSSYRVGVPKPTVAPVLTAASRPSLDDATITARFHYEYGGVKYQEQDITLTPAGTGDTWTFTPPEKTASVPVTGHTGSGTNPIYTTGTPDQAFPVIHMVATDTASSAPIFDIYSTNSSLLAPADWLLALARNGDSTTYTLTLSINTQEAHLENRAYVYTYVNTYNEEGPPSPPANINAPTALGATVTATRDAEVAGYAPIKEIRFYRTPTGSEIADYFYAGSVQVLTEPGDTFAFTDNTAASALNEPIASTDYYPPNPALVGLLTLPNGILCAWKDNELHFSDAYKPWSWPPQYVKTFRVAIVGAIAHGSGVLLTTATGSTLVSGVSPDSMTESKTGLQQAGVSKQSMADIGGAIVYASHDGLVTVSGGQASLQPSEQFFTRDVWRQRYGSGLSSMRFAVWDGRLIAYSSTGAFTAFLIRLDEAAGSMTELPSFVAKCSFVSPLSDQCYYVNGTNLYQFAGGDDLSATWQSREIVMNAPVNLAFAEAVCSGSWQVKFYSNDESNDFVLRHTETLTARRQFRLPDGFKSDRWKVAVSGTGRFRELRAAGSAAALKEF